MLMFVGRATQKHDEYTGPTLGPKMATKNERNFSEEQIRQGRDGVIGLQSGSNKGASQVHSTHLRIERHPSVNKWFLNMLSGVSRIVVDTTRSFSLLT